MTNFEENIEPIIATSKKQLCFVFGTEKSGTTWLQKLLNSHPEIVCRGEGQFMTELIPPMTQAFNNYNKFIDNLHKKVFSEIEQFPQLGLNQQQRIEQFSILSSLSQYDEGQETKVVAEKTPGNIRHLEQLHQLFPQAKFLLIHRDLRDVCVSGWHHLHRQYTDIKEPLFNYIKRTTPAWLNDYEKVIEFKKQHSESLYEISYEDLLYDTSAIIEPVYRWLAVDTSTQIISQCVDASSFKTLSKGRKEGEEEKNSHFRKGIAGDWLNHFDLKMCQLCDELALETLSSMGYESSVKLFNKYIQANPKIEIKNIAIEEITPTLITDNNQFKTGNDENLQIDNKFDTGKLETLKRKLERKKNNHKLWYQLALEQIEIEQTEEAIESLKKCIELSKNDYDAYYKIASIYNSKKAYKKAEESYFKCTQLRPGDALSWRLYGMSLNHQDKKAAAITALKKSLLRKKDISTWNLLIMLQKDLEQLDEAKEQGNLLLQYKSDKAIKNCNKGLTLAQRELPTFQINKNARNIISFSLWGNDPTYTKGAIENTILAKNLYYGWQCQFFCDHSVPKDVTDELQDHGAKVRFIKDNNIINFKAFWRFLASDMQNVDRFICRDTDSRLNCQEVNAVDEWLHSDKPFHIMRDHYYHVELILAGMWGGVAGILPNLRQLSTKDSKYTKTRWGDQLFLQNAVWPLIHDKVLIHDSIYTMKGTKPYPGHYRLPGEIHVGGAIKVS